MATFLDASIKLKSLMPKDSPVADPIYNLSKDKDPTLGDYINMRKSLLNDEIHKSRSQKKEVMVNLKADF